MHETNGELESTLIGITLIVGAAWLLATAVIPWQPWLGCTFIGVYLMLPKRMQKITESVRLLLARSGKSNNKDKSNG